MRYITILRKRVKGELLSDSDLELILADGDNLEEELERLIRNNELIKLKKGYYVFCERYRKNPLDTLHLSNFLEGPSYVSFDSALLYYKAISRKNDNITATSMRRIFSQYTPVGNFTYKQVPPVLYTFGIVSAINVTNFLIASPEKALLDKLFFDHLGSDIWDFLANGINIDREFLKTLDLESLRNYSRLYGRKKFESQIDTLIEIIGKQPVSSPTNGN